MRSLALGVAAALGLTLLTGAACTEAATPPRSAASTGAPSAAPTHARSAFPALVVRRKVTGLDHPWDVRPIDGGRLIFTQRERATVSIWDHGSVRTVQGFPSDKVWVSGETGLMGLDIDPRFTTDRRLYTCQGGTRAGGGHDVRIYAWTLDDDLTRVTSRKLLLAGLPATSGRHGGCRLLAVGSHKLYAGTGDAATGANPENKRSLGGKTLCLDPRTGRPCPSNPFPRAAARTKRYVHTFGHRNVQGLDQRRDGTLWSIEQGTYRDDEVNRLRNGADYGYNPVPGYNESVPMTDHGLPGPQHGAAWSSGDPTLATSGGGFVYGRRWGGYDGRLAVAALKAERVLFVKLSRTGKLRGVRTPAALRHYGRIRTVVDGPGSVIYVATDNGEGRDAILSVHPSSHAAR